MFIKTRVRLIDSKRITVAQRIEYRAHNPGVVRSKRTGDNFDFARPTKWPICGTGGAVYFLICVGIVFGLLDLS